MAQSRTRMLKELETKLVARDKNSLTPRKWTIAESDRGGRGVFATCDIASGEFIFADLPILTGPKLSSDLVACTSCSNNQQPLRNCTRNCHLPFCSEKCENEESHPKECYFLRSLKLKEEEWSPYIYRALTLIRSILMPDADRDVVKLLYANRGKQVDIQVSALLTLLGTTLNEQEVSWLRHCCGVLDGTAFEIELQGATNSLKGLFPLSAMMNHNCVPNTRHSYTGRTEGYKMVVVATKFIPKGSEIFTSYCPLLWATNLRRTFLLHTKHFQCSCERCGDPTEFGTSLQALRCKCGQILLPLNPLSFNSDWECRSCGEVKTAKYTMMMQQNMKNQADLGDKFPQSNYIHIQMGIDSFFKKTKGVLEGLTDEELNETSIRCTNVLQVIDQLQLGNTTFKGKLCSQLGKVMREMERRRMTFENLNIKNYIECGLAIKNQDESAMSKCVSEVS